MTTTPDHGDRRGRLWQVGAAVVLLGLGVWLLVASWGFVFRDYRDSPLFVYAVFSAPMWVPGLALVALSVALVHPRSAPQLLARARRRGR